MSTRIDPPDRPVEDDDWFATGQERTVEIDQRSSPEPPRYLPPAPTPPDLGRRQAALGLAVLVAIFLVLAGIVIGRATESSSTKTVTVTAAQPEETPATTHWHGRLGRRDHTGHHNARLSPRHPPRIPTPLHSDHEHKRRADR